MSSDFKGICKIVKVIDEFKIVINKGANDGIKEGYKFLIYSLGSEILDPDTKESLGVLEIVKGYGKATHVQSKMTTVESCKVIKKPGTKTVVRNRNPLLAIAGDTETITYDEDTTILPFESPEVGDLAKYMP